MKEIMDGPDGQPATHERSHSTVSPPAGECQAYVRGSGWRADCAKCVGSKFPCDEHYLTRGEA